MIKIYDSTEKEYATNGLGTVETYKCEEEKNISLNGWKITVECPLKYADLIVRDRIATAETKEKGMQPFRIGNVEKKGSRLYFTAWHVVFDTENYVLANVRPTGLNPVAYANWLITHADQAMPFSVKGSATGTCPTRDFVRKTVKDGLDQLLEDMPDVIIDPDKWDINVYDSSRVGSDQGRKITYGRNLQDWQITENWDDVCTKILPEGSNGLTLPEVYLESSTQYATPYTKTISFDIPDQDDAGNAYSDDQKITMLRTQAREYLKTHAAPKVSYEIKSDIPQELCINDTVRVLHPMLTLTAHVQGYTYDCNSRRVLSVTFGNYDPSPASTLSGTVEDLKKRTEKVRSDQEKAIAIQTALIKNLSKNGYVYIDDNEIDVLDKLPRSSAKNVWRWTLGGLGFSSTGVDGTFTTAITQDGRINADFITTGVLSADLIKAGVLQDANGVSQWSLDTGLIKTKKFQAFESVNGKDYPGFVMSSNRFFAYPFRAAAANYLVALSLMVNDGESSNGKTLYNQPTLDIGRGNMFVIQATTENNDDTEMNGGAFAKHQEIMRFNTGYSQNNGEVRMAVPWDTTGGYDFKFHNESGTCAMEIGYGKPPEVGFSSSDFFYVRWKNSTGYRCIHHHCFYDICDYCLFWHSKRICNWYYRINHSSCGYILLPIFLSSKCVRCSV